MTKTMIPIVTTHVLEADLDLETIEDAGIKGETETVAAMIVVIAMKAATIAQAQMTNHARSVHAFRLGMNVSARLWKPT